jgi:hypothetical protein
MSLLHLVERCKFGDFLYDVIKLDFIFVLIEGLAIDEIFTHVTLKTEHIIQAACIELQL